MPQESLVDNPSLPFSLRTIEERKLRSIASKMKTYFPILTSHLTIYIKFYSRRLEELG